MIKVKIAKDKIILEGHAFYSTYGKDIVCASVSSIATTTINAIISIDNKAITYKVEDAYLQIKIIKRTDVVNKLINNMLDLFKTLEQDYPKNIKVMEV